MRRLLSIALAASGCTSPTPASDDAEPTGSAIPAFPIANDPGLDGPPFALDDPTCTPAADRISCSAVVYSVVDGVSLHLDLIAPPDAAGSRRPTIVYLHPGGWSVGSYHQLAQLATSQYLARGYVIVSVEYRLTLNPDHSVSGVTFPDNLKDVKTAVRWLRTRGADVVDDDRILVYGVSAGAHLGSLVATTADVADLDGRGDPSVPTSVRAFVGVSTPIEFHWFVPANPALDGSCPMQPRGQDPQQGVSWLIGGDLGDPSYADELVALSAPTYFAPTTPPMLLFAGTCDQTVPYQETIETGQRATALGLAQIQTVIVPGAFHDTTLDPSSSQAVLDAFVSAQLGSVP